MGSLATDQRKSIQFHEDEVENRRQIVEVLANAMQGKLNNRGTGTLANGANTTTVTDARAGPFSVIYVMPTSVNAAGKLIGYGIFTRSVGSFVISHVAPTTTDCTFEYVIFG